MFLESKANVLVELKNRDGYLLKRISTYCENFGEDPLKVEQKICNDPMFAATFAKDPKRTGFHKKVANHWLNQQLGLKVMPLHHQGTDALFITGDGRITKISVRFISKTCLKLRKFTNERPKTPAGDPGERSTPTKKSQRIFENPLAF